MYSRTLRYAREMLTTSSGKEGTNDGFKINTIMDLMAAEDLEVYKVLLSFMTSMPFAKGMF